MHLDLGAAEPIGNLSGSSGNGRGQLQNAIPNSVRSGSMGAALGRVASWVPLWQYGSGLSSELGSVPRWNVDAPAAACFSWLHTSRRRSERLMSRGSLNVGADALSRNDLLHFLQVVPEAARQPTPSPSNWWICLCTSQTPSPPWKTSNLSCPRSSKSGRGRRRKPKSKPKKRSQYNILPSWIASEGTTRLDITTLVPTVQRLLQAGLACSTQRTY